MDLENHERSKRKISPSKNNSSKRSRSGLDNGSLKKVFSEIQNMLEHNESENGDEIKIEPVSSQDFENVASQPVKIEEVEENSAESAEEEIVEVIDEQDLVEESDEIELLIEPVEEPSREGHMVRFTIGDEYAQGNFCLILCKVEDSPLNAEGHSSSPDTAPAQRILLSNNNNHSESEYLLPVDHVDFQVENNTEALGSEDETPLASLVRRKRIRKDSDVSKFLTIAIRCSSERNIWDYRMRSDQQAEDRDDWPVLVVRGYQHSMNMQFMCCIRENEVVYTGPYALSNSVYIFYDVTNKKEIGCAFKIHFPLLIVDLDHVTHVLGVNNLESVQRLSMNGHLNSLLSSDQIFNEGVTLHQLVDTGNETTYVLGIRTMHDFDEIANRGEIAHNCMVRFLLSDPLVVGNVVGWAEFPISVFRVTGILEEYIVILRDAVNCCCAMGLSADDFAKLKRVAEVDGDLGLRKLKVRGFRFSHVLPREIIPRLKTNTVSITGVESVFPKVYLLIGEGASSWSFEEFQ